MATAPMNPAAAMTPATIPVGLAAAACEVDKVCEEELPVCDMVAFDAPVAVARLVGIREVILATAVGGEPVQPAAV